MRQALCALGAARARTLRAPSLESSAESRWYTECCDVLRRIVFEAALAFELCQTR
jgi:hypothetical protein